MIHDFKNSSAKRVEDLKLKKEKEDEEVNAKKRTAKEIRDLKFKKQKLLEEKNEQLSEIDSKLNSLMKKIL